ncbi:MAG TPA: LPS export ABC transporter permease LptF [Thermodesulfobacteriota bacterium]|nr:LPS export ABC transporter permease LptF [Thermodesulfobacteriota bacterium]
MGMKWTIYRYVAREILPAFFLGLVGFTFILLTGRILQLTELFVNKGVPLHYLLKFLYFLFPSFLVLTIPMATLLSVMLAFNRLSNDNEITALKASGISLYQMTPPVWVFAASTFAATTLLSLYAVPNFNVASRALLFEVASTKASAGFRERVFNDDFEGLVLYVDHIKPKTLLWENIFISDSRTREPYTIMAREGEVMSDPKALSVVLRLKNGSIHKLGKEADSYQKIDFENYDLRLYLKTGMKEKRIEEKHPADMTLSELSRAIRLQQSKNADFKTPLVKIHEKFSIPFACLIFALVGVPLGLQSRARKSRSRGFAFSIGVLLVYYLFTNAGTSLAERGAIVLELGMWLPNIIFLLLGGYLLVKAANESPVAVVVWVQKLAERFRRHAGDKTGGAAP